MTVPQCLGLGVNMKLKDLVHSNFLSARLKLLVGFPLLLGLLASGAWLFSAVPFASAAPENTQSIAVPSYFDPEREDFLWSQLDGAADTVGLAVINPNDGPADSKNDAYVAQVASSQAAGIIVLGYVYTLYGSRNAQQVKSEIDDYYRWYDVDGIFLDEVTTDCVTQPYYAELNDYIKLKGAEQLTVLNPGTQPSECYMSVGDILTNFEDGYTDYANNYWQPEWVKNYDASRFWHLVLNVTSAQDMRNAIRLSKERNAGWIYVTPDKLPNPWDTLPIDPYWTDELTEVSAINVVNTPLSVTVTTDKPSYQKREKAWIAAQVTDDTTRVEGAAVYIEITTAKGRRVDCNLTTDSNGEAGCLYRVKSKRDGVGEYTLVARVSKTGFASGSGSTTFQVTE